MADPEDTIPTPPTPTVRPNMNMLASEKLINFIKDKEGFHSEPYEDYKQYSIGHGSYAGKLTSDPTITTITKAGADQLLREEIKKYEANVSKFNYYYDFTQNEFDALVSFAYNIGSIDKLTNNGKRSKEEILQKIPEYKKAGGKVLQGLVDRRGEEASIFEGEDYPSSYNENNITPSSLREEGTTDEIGSMLYGPQIRTVNMNQGYDGDPGYPILEEKVETVTGAVAGTAVNLATRFFPGRVESAISGALSETLGDIPQVSTLAKEIIESGLTGKGIPTITSAIERIAAPDTLAGRIQESISLAQENREFVKVLAPQFESLLDFDQMGAYDRLRAVYTAAEESGTKIQELEELSAALQQTPQVGGSLEDLIFNPENLPTLASVASLIKGTPEQQNAHFSGLFGLAEVMERDPAKKQQIQLLRKAGTLSIEDLLTDPAISETLGTISDLDVLRGTSAEVQERLGSMAVSEIAGETDLGKVDTRTLVLGSDNPEEVKKLRESAGGLVLDDFIESNPTLKSIIEFFANNKEIITLLGSAGAVAGLSGILGGGPIGSFAAGAGTVAVTRMLLGEEGFGEVTNILQTAAAPVFNVLGDLFEKTGLSEIPFLGSGLQSILGVAEQNPLAALAAATGNFGAAAGLFAGTKGVELYDNGQLNMAAALESLSNIKFFENQVPQNLATEGQGRTSHIADPSGNPTLGGNTDGFPSHGIARSIYVDQIYGVTNDFGYGNMGGIAGAAGSI